MEFNIKLKRGQVLKGMIESPGENTKAVIVLVHGLGEHTGRYSHVAAMFKKQGIGFAGVDLPGHGKSDGRRGNIASYAIVSEMIDILLSSCKKTFPGVPLYLYGHSLGGGIALDYLLRKNPKINGAIVTSPWLRLSFEPPKFKVLMASVMKNIVPGLIQPSGLNVDHISHDTEVVDRYKSDPLVHDKISVSLFHGAMNAGAYSLAHSADLKVPVLLIHGSDDKITSPDGSRQFAANNPKVTLKIWDGGYHELHNEPFKEEVFKYIIDWMKLK